MKRIKLKRDGLNRVMGSYDNNDFFANDDEFYKDHKVKGKDILFPNHGNTEPSPVVTYNINDLHK